MPKPSTNEVELYCPICNQKLEWYAYYSFNDVDIYRCPKCGALWEETKALQKPAAKQESAAKPSNNKPILRGLVQRSRKVKGFRIALWPTDELKKFLKDLIEKGE